MPTRLRGGLVGEEVEKPGEETIEEAMAATGRRGEREEVKRFLCKLKLKRSFWLNPFVANSDNMSSTLTCLFVFTCIGPQNDPDFSNALNYKFWVQICKFDKRS